MHPGRTSPFHDFKLRNHEQEFNEDNKDPGRHHSSAGPHRAGRQCHPFSPRQTSLLATADSKSPSALCFPAHAPFPPLLDPSTSANRAQSSPWQPTKGDGHGRRQPQCMRWDQQTPVLTALGSHHAILLLGCGTVGEVGPRRVRIPNSTLPTLLVAKRVLQRRPSTCFSTPSDHQPAQGGTRQQAQWPANSPERAQRA